MISWFRFSPSQAKIKGSPKEMMIEETDQPKEEAKRRRGMRGRVFCLRVVFVLYMMPLVFAAAAAGSV